MSIFPTTQKEYLKAVARETARMSYPGSMSRGKKQVLKEGAKKKIEEFFATFLGDLWDSVDSVTNQFDVWHEKQARKLGQYLRDNGRLGKPENNSDVVGAKLINTFMYQLMKYERFRPLWNSLHLPLDGKTLRILQTLNCPSLISVKEIIKRPPYSLSYDEYCQIQRALREVVVELNKRPEVEYNLLTSRIELNLLWAD